MDAFHKHSGELRTDPFILSDGKGILSEHSFFCPWPGYILIRNGFPLSNFFRRMQILFDADGFGRLI